MRVSVIIPNLHSPRIAEVLDALAAQQPAPDEIIVVGQDRYGLLPRDGSVQIIDTPQPVGPARARNLGAGLAHGDALLFLDADCIAEPGVIAALRARIATGAHVLSAAVQVAPDASYWMLCDNLLVFGAIWNGAPAGPRLQLPSLALMLSRHAWQLAGPFDERFGRIEGEDHDLSVRMRRLGLSLEFEPQAVVTHRPQRDSMRDLERHLRAFGRAHARLALRYGAEYSPALANWPERLRPLLPALTPLLALLDTVQSYRTQPVLRRHPQAAAGLYWGKLAWYLGVFEVLANHVH